MIDLREVDDTQIKKLIEGALTKNNIKKSAGVRFFIMQELCMQLKKNKPHQFQLLIEVLFDCG